MCRRSVFLATVLLFLMAVCSARFPLEAQAAGGIVLSADACFAQMSPGGAAYPIKVTAENTGPSASGVIEVSEADYAQSQRFYDYPIDLPSGTVKQLIVYPHLESYASTVDIEFKGRAAARSVALNVSAFNTSSDDPGVRVGLVGDDIGGLAVAHPRPASNAGNTGAQDSSGYNPLNFTDSYCKPEDAPDRSIGYSSLRLLVLGAGSERLNPDQWAAIREWVSGGGDLLFLGGAGSLACLQSPGAAILCPLQGLRESSASGFSLELPGKSVTAPLRSSVALLEGTPVPGAAVVYSHNGLPVMSRRLYGSGVVSLAAFNPLEEPLRGSQQDAGVLQDLLLTGRTGFNVNSSFTDGFFSRNSGSAQGNPFHIDLPPISQIALIFGVYFLLVVPVTFFVLRKRGRLEWAWVTTPLLSVAFAGVVYLYSANLYKSGLSRRTAGVVSVAAGDPDAYFKGYSELFIPRGGSYDIAVPGAQRLEQVNLLDDESSGSGPAAAPGSAAFTTTDTVDGVAALGYGVGNLAFRRLYYSQPVRLSGTVDGKITSSGHSLIGQLTNNTPLALTQAAAYAPVQGLACAIGDLQPGQTITLKPMSRFMESKTASDLSMEIVPSSTTAEALPRELKTGADSSAFIVGRAPGSSFGPQMGRDVSGGESVIFIESIPLERSGAK